MHLISFNYVYWVYCFRSCFRRPEELSPGNYLWRPWRRWLREPIPMQMARSQRMISMLLGSVAMGCLESLVLQDPKDTWGWCQGHKKELWILRWSRDLVTVCNSKCAGKYHWKLGLATYQQSHTLPAGHVCWDSWLADCRFRLFWDLRLGFQYIINK